VTIGISLVKRNAHRDLAGAATEFTEATVRQLPQSTSGIELLAHQNEYSGENGKYCQYRSQTIEK
jgi:hypothetical protein